MTNTATPLKFQISQPVTIGDTTEAELSFIHQMMHWLRINNLPYGSTENSLYLFAKTYHVVGCIELRPADDATWIQAIYVDPGLRQRRIGQCLMQAAVDKYLAPDHPIGLGTRPTNTAMKALANKMGFTHEIHEHWRK